MSLTGHHMPPRTTQQSHRPRVSDRTMVGTLPPRCLQALPHGTKNAATDGPGYRATPRSTTEPHRGWMSDTYLLHLHAEGEKCFLLTSPFIEPRNATLHNRAAQGLDVRHLPSPSPCGRGEVFSLDIPFYRTYLLHLHAEGEKCFLLTSPFIEPALYFALTACTTSFTVFPINFIASKVVLPSAFRA